MINNLSLQYSYTPSYWRYDVLIEVTHIISVNDDESIRNLVLTWFRFRICFQSKPGESFLLRTYWVNAFWNASKDGILVFVDGCDQRWRNFMKPLTAPMHEWIPIVLPLWSCGRFLTCVTCGCGLIEFFLPEETPSFYFGNHSCPMSHGNLRVPFYAIPPGNNGLWRDNEPPLSLN